MARKAGQHSIGAKRIARNADAQANYSAIFMRAKSPAVVV
jgi:hypothetical protein